MEKSLVGQGAGAVSAYQREGASLSGRAPRAGMQPVAGGGEWADAPRTCNATRKDGAECSAPVVGDNSFCIGHLRGAKEGI